MNYYNEHDPNAAVWLRWLIKRQLIPQGLVDERSITEVQAEDLKGFTQCHFFAGIGGWSLALQLAGWPSERPVWTGSCPCQPFSTAGKRNGKEDERHLWPVWFELLRRYTAISQREPVPVFGEQVASAIRHGWLDGVCTDLEGEGYAVGHAVLGAHSFGAPHIRQRLYWVAVPSGGRCEGSSVSTGWRAEREGEIDQLGVGSRLANSISDGRGTRGREDGEHDGNELTASRSSERVAHARHSTISSMQGEQLQKRNCGVGQSGHWNDFDLIPCRDGKTRRVKSGVRCLAHGVPGRVGLIRGFGNAIVPEVGGVWVSTCMELLK